MQPFFVLLSRSHQSKGENHQRQNMERLKRHMEATGKTYDPTAATAQRHAAAAAALGGAARGSVAVATHSRAVAQAMVDTEYARSLIADFARNEPPVLNSIVAEAISEGLVDLTTRHFVQGGRCRLCDKDAHETHVSCDAHKRMIEMSAAISYVLGMPVLARKNFMGIVRNGQEPMTQVLFKAWWGSTTEHMAQVCRRILNSPIVRGVDFRTPQESFFVEKQHVRITELLIVPYTTGMGMYSRHSRRVLAHKWQNVPEGTHSLETAVGTAVGTAVDTTPQDPSELGYWPVLRWQAQPTARPMVQNAVESKVFVSCIYQWIECPEEGKVTAWMLDEAELPMIPEMP